MLRAAASLRRWRANRAGCGAAHASEGEAGWPVVPPPISPIVLAPRHAVAKIKHEPSYIQKPTEAGRCETAPDVMGALGAMILCDDGAVIRRCLVGVLAPATFDEAAQSVIYTTRDNTPARLHFCISGQ